VPQRRNWVLTGSLENFRVTRDNGFGVIGLKERHRRLAQRMEPGDLVAFYVTKVQAFGAIARVTGAVREDRTPLWPGKPGKPDPYPWRLAGEAVVVLEEDDFVPAVGLAPELRHVRKWPRDHWQLAFQGQIRTIPEEDMEKIEKALSLRRMVTA
jgi:predicted RNA-binding protein